MSALTSERRLRKETWKYRSYTLTGAKGWKGGVACYDQSVGKVVPAATGAGDADLVPLGFFAETVDATSADAAVVVEHFYEMTVYWFKNDGTNPVTVNDLGKDIYMVDDQTVSISSATSTRSVLGKARAIDTTLGVAVEVK